ncbi:centromere protein U-like isoform X1 [Synchiropus splendidus]|uniref:centromere protein U-like isoform X1 n=2 Tax=Synchiropus splendidus TaxID=270530 RepID=UPI00237DAA5E|nr:centromere protein U-like isoform X1 [Synchiropus splendidus]
MSSARNMKRSAARQEVHQQQSLNSPDLSAIEKASFLDGLVCDDGNPLHSTALEDNLNTFVVPSEEAGTPDTQQTAKRNRKPRPPEINGKPKKEAAGGKKVVSGKKPLKQNAAEAPAPAKRPGKVKQPPASHVKVHPKRANGETEEEAGNPMNAESEGDLDSGINKKKRRSHILSSDDDDDDEEKSWKPSPKKATRNRVIRKQETSKKSPAAGDPGKAAATSSGKKSTSGGTEPEVMLTAFVEYCAQYRDSVESEAVKEAIDMFADNVRSQLTEKISSEKNFLTLKRENAKLAVLIAKKKQQLLQAKNELMSAEREFGQLKRVEADLHVRLSDLKKGRAFLSSIKEVRQQYLDLRCKKPLKK